MSLFSIFMFFLCMPSQQIEIEASAAGAAKFAAKKLTKSGAKKMVKAGAAAALQASGFAVGDIVLVEVAMVAAPVLVTLALFGGIYQVDKHVKYGKGIKQFRKNKTFPKDEYFTKGKSFGNGWAFSEGFYDAKHDENQLMSFNNSRRQHAYLNGYYKGKGYAKGHAASCKGTAQPALMTVEGKRTRIKRKITKKMRKIKNKLKEFVGKDINVEAIQTEVNNEIAKLNNEGIQEGFAQGKKDRVDQKKRLKGNKCGKNKKQLNY